MSWIVSDHRRTAEVMLTLESVFALGNGYLGVRGNVEEGYPDSDGLSTIRGTYLNAFHDVIDIPYGEKLYAFPDTQQKLVNLIDAQTILFYLGEEEELLSLNHGTILSYERMLHMDKGFSERRVHWRSPLGKEIKVTFRRLVSFTQKELFAIDVTIEPVNFTGKVKVVSRVDGNVSNYTNPNDPRVGAGHAKRLTVVDYGTSGECGYVVDETMTSAMQVACVTRHVWTRGLQEHVDAGATQGHAKVDAVQGSARVDADPTCVNAMVDADTPQKHAMADVNRAQGHAKVVEYATQANVTTGHWLLTCEGAPTSTPSTGVMTFVSSTLLTEPVRFTKWNIYTDTLRHQGDLVKHGLLLQNALTGVSFDELLEQQRRYLDAYWRNADVEIDNDTKLQEGIRFNLYQLLQSAGRDAYSNISAKGLSGEGYEGHYFWDTEIYMFPVFLMTNPAIAKQLLIYRHSTLTQARERAKAMGHVKGALFPWRTISGTECSSFFPSGTAQYHISADVAYSYIQYYIAEQDNTFLMNYGAEVLFETARLWLEIGHYYKGSFHIDEVTGPDEYTCLVNNNYYTNVMAKHNLRWAAKAYEILKSYDEAAWTALNSRLGVTTEEKTAWQHASDSMLLLYDEALGINPQDDTFLRKAVWDFANTPKEHYPLLLHYHPLTIYRYQVCKQADTVLAHMLLEDEQDAETIRLSYDYYERITTHDSSLSSCIFSIMACKNGDHDKAYQYFIETARLDLDNTHGNTKDGLHLANMGGTWMAIVYGFAGMRLKESGLSLAPAIPAGWVRYAFRLTYRGRLIGVTIRNEGIELSLLEGDEISIILYGADVHLKKEQPIKQPLR